MNEQKEKDSVGDHLKSDEYKSKKEEILKKASDIIEKNKDRPRVKKSPEEIQSLIETYREQLHKENMQPPPPPTFVDENGKPIFENKSEVNLNVGMPRRFKGSRAGEIPLEERKPVKEDHMPPELSSPREFNEMTSVPQQQAYPPQPPQPTQHQREIAEREFYQTTDLVFHDISGEEYREYMYNNGGILRINNPWKLAVSRSNNHRIVTRDGFSYIIAPNWIAIRFRKREGEPSFAF